MTNFFVGVTQLRLEVAMSKISEHLDSFKQRIQIYPQPIALALGRIIRAEDEREIVDSSLRAAEVLARYLAALSMASFATRVDVTVNPPPEYNNFRGNLSFGHFADVLQGTARANVMHPLSRQFSAAFRIDSPGYLALKALVQLRNQLGHDLGSLTCAKAQIVLRDNSPTSHLAQMLDAAAGLLELPLFFFEDLSLVNKRLVARRILLMGEGEPMPDFVEPTAMLDSPNVVYVGHDVGAVNLKPYLHWGVIESRSSHGLYLLDGIKNDICYVSVWDDELSISNQADNLIISGNQVRDPEYAMLKGGVSFLGEWMALKKIRLQQALPDLVPVPWSDFDMNSVRWYENMLTHSKPEKLHKPGSIITKYLLDGRNVVSRSEMRQLQLLFGNIKTVFKILNRPTLDLRATDSSQNIRWVERKECISNLLDTLRDTIDFFSKHDGIGSLNLEGFTATGGNADYIAMRESLTNLLIHQDYSSGPVAQIEIGKHLTLFHNFGSSLVSIEGLVDGGRSTPRNPLVARAFRLIGFAELAGSGLRALHKAWRQELRRPPEIDSNISANTFTISLDNRPVAPAIDAFWYEKIGVKVNPEQAKVLEVLHALDTLTVSQVASGANLRLTEALHALSYLKVQALIIEADGRYHLRPDLAPLLKQKDSNE